MILLRKEQSPLKPSQAQALACAIISGFAGLLLLTAPAQANALSFEEADLPAGAVEWHVHLIALGLAIFLAIVCVIPFIWRRHD